MTVLRRTGQIYCRMPIYWDLSDVSVMVRPALRVLGRKTPEVKCVLLITSVKGACRCRTMAVLTSITG